MSKAFVMFDALSVTTRLFYQIIRGQCFLIVMSYVTFSIKICNLTKNDLKLYNHESLSLRMLDENHIFIQSKYFIHKNVRNQK